MKKAVKRDNGWIALTKKVKQVQKDRKKFQRKIKRLEKDDGTPDFLDWHDMF